MVYVSMDSFFEGDNYTRGACRYNRSVDIKVRKLEIIKRLTDSWALGGGGGEGLLQASII